MCVNRHGSTGLCGSAGLYSLQTDSESTSCYTRLAARMDTVVYRAHPKGIGLVAVAFAAASGTADGNTAPHSGVRLQPTTSSLTRLTSKHRAFTCIRFFFTCCSGAFSVSRATKAQRYAKTFVRTSTCCLAFCSLVVLVPALST